MPRLNKETLLILLIYTAVFIGFDAIDNKLITADYHYYFGMFAGVVYCSILRNL